MAQYSNLILWFSVPVNCRFEVDDIENDWTWTEPFDFIFSRMMVGSFANWDNFMNEASLCVLSPRHLLVGYVLTM
jgi:hypothetical protein